MTILTSLADHEQWLAFFEYKKSGGHLSKWDEKDLLKFIENREYLPVAENILSGGAFAPPSLTVINKKHTGKKRTVYTFRREENYCLKLLTWLLGKYDYLFSPNLYSFRAGQGVKKAFYTLLSQAHPGRKYTYKIDVRDYFNSVDVALLLPRLEEALGDDPALLAFLTALLKDPRAIRNGQTVEVKKGIMAGSPISGFLANLFLTPMDFSFYRRNIPYARYSDDVIVFADSPEELSRYIGEIDDTLYVHGLAVNPDKVEKTIPGEAWTYLGFTYDHGVVDISPVSFEKVKAKLKRKARALYRWKIRKSATDGQAIRAYIRYFNRKFFSNPVKNELTWCRWYFPLITTDRTLKEIDHYMQSCIRYIATGHYTKANYNLRYETMRQWGLRSLVGEFYRNKNSDY